MRQYIADAALDTFTRSGADMHQVEGLDDLVGRLVAFESGGPRDALSPSALSSTLQGRIEVAVQQQAGALRQELAEALLVEVRRSIGIALADHEAALSQRPDTSTSEVGYHLVWVCNERSGIVHAVSIGPDSELPADVWTSRCGWAFGRSGGFKLSPAPTDAIKCKRCLVCSPS